MESCPQIVHVHIRQHDETEIRRCLVIMQFIAARTVRDKCVITVYRSLLSLLYTATFLEEEGPTDGPDSFRTMFRREKTTPNISFASSCTLKRPAVAGRPWRVSAGAGTTGTVAPSVVVEAVEGRVWGAEGAWRPFVLCHCLM